VDKLPPKRLLEALRTAHKRKARIVSICSGVFVLAAAGLFDGRRVTSHWAEADKLAQRHPRLQVDPNVLYVDDGDILSSAGRAAGLDLCLHIVRQDYGMDTANHVARRLVVAPHRDGGQAQFIPQPVRTANDPLKDVYAWARQNIDRDLTVANLAAKARMSRRTFIRRFTAATGLPPGEWVLEARVKEAQILLETNDLSIEQVSTAAGFGSADALRHHFRTRLHTSPQRYRSAFRGSRRTANAPAKICRGRKIPP
jgi:AraC family transcriptional regulator, transcriptional activator FtrA